MFEKSVKSKKKISSDHLDRYYLDSFKKEQILLNLSHHRTTLPYTNSLINSNLTIFPMYVCKFLNTVYKKHKNCKRNIDTMFSPKIF